MSAPTNRKKSTRQSREVRTTAILEAARSVFEQRGYDKATVAEIAELVGVVEGTVFSYFSSKRMLVLKVMEQFYEEITSLIEEGLQGVNGTRNQLHYVIWNHLNIVQKNAALAGVILRESRGLDEKLSDEVHNLNKRYTQSISVIVANGIKAGDIKAETSPSLVRNSIFGTIEHYMWEILSAQVQVNTDEVANNLTELIFNGIAQVDTEVNHSDVNRLIGKLNKLID